MTIQIDKYTKGVLTIIAIALMIIALKGTGLFPKAFAHDGGVHKIAICDKYGSKCAAMVDNHYIGIYNFGL